MSECIYFKQKNALITLKEKYPLIANMPGVFPNKPNPFKLYFLNQAKNIPVVKIWGLQFKGFLSYDDTQTDRKVEITTLYMAL